MDLVWLNLTEGARTVSQMLKWSSILDTPEGSAHGVASVEIHQHLRDLLMATRLYRCSRILDLK